MVLLWIGIAIGVLIATILIVKAVKTPSRDVMGVQLQFLSIKVPSTIQ